MAKRRKKQEERRDQLTLLRLMVEFKEIQTKADGSTHSVTKIFSSSALSRRSRKTVVLMLIILLMFLGAYLTDRLDIFLDMAGTFMNLQPR
jgi:hypothetical protein